MGLLFTACNVEERDRKANVLLDQSLAHFQVGNKDSGYYYLSQSKEMFWSDDNAAVKLEKDLSLVENEDIAKILVQLMAFRYNSEYMPLKQDSFRFRRFEYAFLNRMVTEKLRATQDQHETWMQAYRDEQMKEKRLPEKMTPEERRKKVHDQFSDWDGSHPGLTDLVKESMKDPDSYKHLETSFVDKGDHIYVIMEYSGNNSFGARVPSRVEARVDFQGNVISVVKQN